jgi:hypothetical protein
MLKIFLGLWTLFFCGLLGANPLSPERKIESNTVFSERDPKIKIEVPKTARYIGADRWNLYEIADCEIHVFVEADEEKSIKKYYWIQFESYLPSKPEYSYSYKGGHDMSIAGLDFNVRARFGATSDPIKPGSDLERVVKLISARGYKLPADIMNVRLVHLLDNTKRKELMIIYGEDLSPTGLRTTDLIGDGTIHPKWTAIEAALIDRAKQNIKSYPQK